MHAGRIKKITFIFSMSVSSVSKIGALWWEPNTNINNIITLHIFDIFMYIYCVQHIQANGKIKKISKKGFLRWFGEMICDMTALA